jgi:hypothetical protein
MQRQLGNQCVQRFLARPIVQRQQPQPRGERGGSVRLVRLEKLLSDITSLTRDTTALRGELEGLAPESSAERLRLEEDLDRTRMALLAVLNERVALLTEEITSLVAQIGPQPVSSAEHPEMEMLGHELVRRERERHQHELQLRPLRRWEMHREIGALNERIADIDRDLASLPPVSDPADPTAELMLLRRTDLARRKEQLVRALTSTTTEYKQFDARWGALRYGRSSECTDIAAAGCGPTSLAIVMNYLFQEDPESLAAAGDLEIVTPRETAAYAATHGRVCNSGTAGDTMVTNVHTGWPGFRGRSISLGEATTQLRNGNQVIFLCKSCTGRTRSGGSKSYAGHFMVLNGVNQDGTVYDVLDPGAREARDIETISREDLQHHVGGFWLIERM